jgi:hypothetical protein
MLQLELQVGPGGSLKSVDVPILAPHEMLAAIHGAGSLNFVSHFLGHHGEEGCNLFWKNAIRAGWGRHHPALAHGGSLETLIPVMFHVDGAEVYSNNEYYLWSWNSPLSSENVFDVKIPFLLLEHWMARDKAVMAGVHHAVCKYIAYSLHWAQKGVGPDLGFNDVPFEPGSYSASLASKPLADGWRLAFAGTKCDAKARVEAHRFKDNYIVYI